MTPTGLHSFTCEPRLPGRWDHMALRSVKAFGHDFDLNVQRQGSLQTISVQVGKKTVFSKTCKMGEAVTVEL